MYFPKLPLFFVLSLLTMHASAQLVVDTVPNPQIMLEQHFGDLVESITNLQTKGATDYWGTFDASASNVGLESGIIMANGDVRLALGVNDLLEVGIFDDNGLEGDDDLTGIAGFPTEDASVLEFDFVANSDLILIHYVFASEEYPEWVANVIYNDCFAIWLDGVNVALLPDLQPVTVNNVNCFGANSDFYVCNDPMNLALVPCADTFNCPLTIAETTNQYDGFTTPLIASLNVTPGMQHHLKIGIADVSDNGADSGVFFTVSGMTATSIHEKTGFFSLDVFPNPTDGDLYYKLDSRQAMSVQLMDVLGRHLAQYEIGAGEGRIDLPGDIKSGIYFLRIPGTDYVKKIVVR